MTLLGSLDSGSPRLVSFRGSWELVVTVLAAVFAGVCNIWRLIPQLESIDSELQTSALGIRRSSYLLSDAGVRSLKST